jgi:hypothetical protein
MMPALFFEVRENAGWKRTSVQFARGKCMHVSGFSQEEKERIMSDEGKECLNLDLRD